MNKYYKDEKINGIILNMLEEIEALDDYLCVEKDMCDNKCKTCDGELCPFKTTGNNCPVDVIRDALEKAQKRHASYTK